MACARLLLAILVVTSPKIKATRDLKDFNREREHHAAVVPQRFRSLLDYSRFYQQRSQSLVQTDLKTSHSDPTPSPRGYPNFLLHWHHSLRENPRLLHCDDQNCFANVVIQVLAHSPPISYFSLTRSHSKRCRRLGVCALCCLELQVSSMFSKIDDECCEPELLAKVNFSSAQPTPLKFFHHLLATLRREETLVHVQSSSLLGSFVEETFVGRLRYQLKCTECHETFSRRVKFRYLSLFLDSGIFDVQDSLSHMFSSSSRISDAALACPACNSTNIIMRVDPRRFPPILCLHVSRSETLSYARERKFVMFPQLLSVNGSTRAAGGSNATYQLYAVIVHDKSSKHKYVVYVKNKSSSWVEVICETCRPVSEKLVMAVKANLLFYKRAETR